MATVLEPPIVELPPPPSEQSVLLRRPRSVTGFASWFTTIDHKKIGILYGVSAFAFFIVGGVEALFIRLQLAQPNGRILSATTYNELFTMHGTTMVFLVVMPLSSAFMNYLLPLQVGARDVAFPRLNAFSYWVFILGALFLYSSFVLGGAPNGGWFGYAPNTSIVGFLPGRGTEFWVIGLLILGITSTAGSANLIVTIINMRAPGMDMLRMPIFTWMTLVSQFLTLFAMPIITVALFLLMFDRFFGSNFFNPAAGGDPVLWQHLFWLFGHPEGYILILPAMGIVSEILPVFSRKPLFGYPVMVFSGIAIGFMSWGVWVHHMFAVGLGPVAVSAFSLSTMLIAVPTGVKIFNWLGTMWKGSLSFTTPMLFAIGFIAMFTIGGLSGVTHSLSAHDRQQTDTYYIVAHFHYVLFGGSIFAIFGGFYYWWPKVFGHLLSDRIGKIQFWLTFIGFNMTFGPMHILGLQGMPRRIYTYDKSLNLAGWNLVASIGAFIIASAVGLFIVNVIWSRRHGEVASGDPWDARSLEWSIPSPSPIYNFAVVPTVHTIDDWWHRKYTEDEEGRLVKIPDDEIESGEEEAAHSGEHTAHLPSPSFYPLLVALGLPIIAYGFLYGRSTGGMYVISAIGALITVGAIYGWAFEPSVEPAVAAHGPVGEVEQPALVGAGAPVELEAGSATELTSGGNGSTEEQS